MTFAAWRVIREQAGRPERAVLEDQVGDEGEPAVVVEEDGDLVVAVLRGAQPERALGPVGVPVLLDPLDRPLELGSGAARGGDGAHQRQRDPPGIGGATTRRSGGPMTAPYAPATRAGDTERWLAAVRRGADT